MTKKKIVYTDAYVQWEAKGFPISTDMLYLSVSELHEVSSDERYGFGVKRFADYILNDEIPYSELVKTLYQYNLINQHQARLAKEGKAIEFKNEHWDADIRESVDKLIAEKKGFTPIPKDIRRTHLRLAKPEQDDTDDFDD